MTTRELEKLRSKLPRRYRLELWRRLSNVSISAIDKVLIGAYENETIINAAIQLAEEYQASQKELKEKIQSL
jgi:hypothetical protein